MNIALKYTNRIKVTSPNQYWKRLCKIVLLACLLLFLGTNLSIAQKLNGRYVLSDGYKSESTPTITISNGTFSEVVPGHVGNTIGEGTVQLKSSKLTFKYLEIPNQDSSHYTVKTSPVKVSPDTAILHLKVVEDDEGPSIVKVWTVDSLNKVVDESMTDSAGYKYLSIPASKKISRVDIIAIPYDVVRLPLSEFYGRSSEIDIELKRVKVNYKAPGEVVYKVLSFNKNKIEVEDAKSKRYTLQRLED